MDRLLRFAFAVRQWLLLRLTPAGQLVAGGICLSAIFGLNTHANLAHQIFCFLALLALLALLAGRRLDAALRIRRRLPRYATAGQPFSYRMAVVNETSRAYTDLEFHEVVEKAPSGKARPGGAVLPGGGHGRWIAGWKALVQSREPVTRERAGVGEIRARGQQDVTVTLTPKFRGRLDFKAVAVQRADPLGLFKSRRPFDLVDTVFVLPRLYRLPPVVLPGRRQFQPGGVSLAGSVGDSEEFVALRDYRPGDPPRHIHWRSWAKAGKPVVKEYQEEFFVRHALVLDTFHTGGNDQRFEEAVSLAASFVSARHSETLLDLLFVGPEAYCFTCGRGLANTDKMLEILSGVSACRDRPFEALMPVLLRRAAQLSACICVLLEWDAPRRRLAGMLRSLGVPLEVFVAAPDPLPDLPDLGPLQDQPHRFHRLRSGRIQEDLDRL